MSYVTLASKARAVYTLQYATLFPYNPFSLCPQDRLQSRSQKWEEEKGQLCPVQTLAMYQCPMQAMAGWELLMKYRI